MCYGIDNGVIFWNLFYSRLWNYNVGKHVKNNETEERSKFCIANFNTVSNKLIINFWGVLFGTYFETY